MRKRSCLRSCGKRCLRAVGKPAAFPSGRECLFSIGGAAVFHISIVRLSHDQAVDGEGHIPRRHQQAPYQDEAPDEAADDEVQHEQRGTAAQGAAARHDPDAHPMDAEGQAAEYPEPEKIQLSIPDAGGFENAVQQPGDGDGQNCLLEKFLDGLGSRHWRHLHSCLHYTGKIETRPGVFEKSGKGIQLPLFQLVISLSLRFGLPRLFQQGLHILAEGVVLPFLPLDLPIFRLQGGPSGGELVHLGPETLGGRQGYGVQAFQFSCRRLKQDDLPLMPPQEFLLVPGLAVLVIQGTELAVGGSVLHGEGQPLHFLLRCPEVCLHLGGSGRRPVATLGQLLIAGDPVFGQEVQRFSGPLQILDGRPVFVAGTLLGFEIVLDVNEQAGLPGALLRLAGGPGTSGDPGGQGLLCVVGAQGLQSGEPLLARSPGGYVLAPFQLVPFPLEAAEQVLQVRAAGQEPVDGGAQLRLVAGAVLFRLMLDVALALVPAGDDDRQAVFFADPVTGAADEVIAPLIGVIVLVVLKADRIENQVIMDVIPVYVGGKDKFIFAAQDLPRQLHADPVGLLRRDLPRFKRLDEVPAQVRALVDGMAAGPGKFDVGGLRGAAEGGHQQLPVRLVGIADIVNGRFQR